MDALILGMFLSPILTVTTAWNTVETGDINTSVYNSLMAFYESVSHENQYWSGLHQGLIVIWDRDLIGTLK